MLILTGLKLFLPVSTGTVTEGGFGDRFDRHVVVGVPEVQHDVGFPLDQRGNGVGPTGIAIGRRDGEVPQGVGQVGRSVDQWEAEVETVQNLLQSEIRSASFLYSIRNS